MTKKPLSIGELLAKERGRLKSLQAGAKEAESTLYALKSLLTEDLAATVQGVAIREEGRKLEVLVYSTQVATRLRFALSEIQPSVESALKLKPGFKLTVQVRARPSSAP